MPRKFLLAALILAGCSKPDERLPIWQVAEDIRVATLADDTAASAYDLEVGLGGTMYLLVPQAREVRVFNPAGDLINTIKTGAAPFVQPAALGTVGGYLWIYDSETRAIDLVQGNGTPFQRVQLGKRSGQDSTRVQFHALLRDGSVLVRETSPSSHRQAAIRIEPATGQRTNIGEVAVDAPGVVFSPLDGMLVSVDLLPATSDSTGVRVTKLNLVGDTVFSTDWRVGAQKSDKSAGPAALMAPNGNIFVRHESAGKRARWTVFGLIGKPTAQFETASSVAIIAAGPQYIYGIDPADGGPSLKRYRLIVP